LVLVEVVVPIFGIIGLGYLGRRLRLLPADAATVLGAYVYTFALPALLYVRLSKVPLGEVVNGHLVAAYAGGILTLGLIVWAMGTMRGLDRRYVGMAVLNATFGNVGYMGVPFNMVAFGERGLPVVALTIALTLTITIVLSMTLGLALLEADLSGGRGERGPLRTLFLSGLFGNPMLLSIALGIACSALGISPPGPVRTLLELLGDTAGPVALFAIGSVLEGARVPREWSEVGLLAGAKLLGLPLLTILWFRWLPVESVPFAIAVLQSGMPTAVTNFVFAQHYGVAVEITAAVTLVSTVGSLLTLSAWLLLLL
jgi:hypothetical protein